MGTDAYIEMVYRNLKGELSPIEFAELNRTTAENSELAQLRVEIEDAWDLSGEEVQLVSEEKTEKLFKRLVKSPQKTSVFSLKNSVISLAAILILVFGSIWLMQDQNLIYDTAGSYTLADNSVVDLREGSVLTVNSISTSERNVSLAGEAFFTIQADKSRPFVILTEHTQVEVLGTSFLVKESGQSTYVVVKEGKVRFSTKSLDEKIELTEGMNAVFDEKDGLRPLALGNLSAWKEGMYEYQDVLLSDVLNELTIIFEEAIRLEDQSLFNCRINAILNAETLEEILNQLSNQLGTNASKKGTSWVLSGGKCK
ncbi:MAG: FecR domain-containing protein [Saprospiraceae bacterium]|nr:FecR domain-containing protein [Saprospiraceae bacterium]